MSNTCVLCADCRFWKKQPPNGLWAQETIDQGVCGRIYEFSFEDNAKAETFNHHGDDSGLMTRSDFGCVHGANK